MTEISPREALRLPKAEFWAPRRITGRDAIYMIHRLDPQEDDAEIAHLAMEVLTLPVLAHLSYANGAARTVASPRIAERATRGGAGKQLTQPLARNLDTLRFFSQLFLHGHRSAEGIAVCKQIQSIHRAVGRIENDDQIFVLSQLILGADRIGRVLGRNPFSQSVLDSLLHFWIGVGTAMGLRDLPESSRELMAWVEDYERRWLEPTAIGHQAAEGYLRGIQLSLPRALRPWARSAFIVLMDDAMRECLGYERPDKITTMAIRAQWSLVAATTPLRSVHLDARWATAFAGRCSARATRLGRRNLPRRGAC